MQPSVEMFCIQKTPHCPVIEAHNFTKCVNVLRKPTAYIWFQLHRMLQEFKHKVTTHSPHAHHAQQALQMMTTNIQISAQQVMQPSVEIFCLKKTHHCTFCSKWCAFIWINHFIIMKYIWIWIQQDTTIWKRCVKRACEFLTLYWRGK